MKKIFNKALKEIFAIGQFNISAGEQMRAVIEAAIEMSAPIIIGASESERNHFGDHQLVSMINAWQDNTNRKFILNADHCQTFESAKKAINSGFNAIHIDGSRLKYRDNIKITRKVVKYARIKNKNIVIEGELGYLRGGSDVHTKKVKILPSDLTKPKEAKDFYEKTGIDNLAVVIGNIHGVEADNKNPRLDIKRLSEIRKAVPKGKFVLHGGSGTSLNDIKKAIGNGIIKININTELRISFSHTLRSFLKDNPREIKPYNILNPTIEATKKIVVEKIKLFGSQNKYEI